MRSGDSRVVESRKHQIYHQLTVPLQSNDRSPHYHGTRLGFDKKCEWGTRPIFASVGREQVEIFLSLNPQGGATTWMSIFVQDVDALYETYKTVWGNHPQAPNRLSLGIGEMTVEWLWVPDGW